MLFLFFLNSFFIIKKIECSANGESCSEEIIQKLNLYKGSNMFFINQKQISASIKNIRPFEKITIGYRIFNTFKITLEGGNSPIIAMVYLVKDLPAISMDLASASSESGSWIRPSEEIGFFCELASASGFGLWESGRMSPVATSESAIKYIISEKPSEEIIKSIYKLVKLIDKYLNVESIQIVGQRVFLRQTDQPDIIVSVPFDEGSVSEAMKSYAYLITIKKDAKVIDLRFINPIIR